MRALTATSLIKAIDRTGELVFKGAITIICLVAACGFIVAILQNWKAVGIGLLVISGILTIAGFAGLAAEGLLMWWYLWRVSKKAT